MPFVIERDSMLGAVGTVCPPPGVRGSGGSNLQDAALTETPDRISEEC